ncbi:RagB/SusD domain-containing protein [Mucilaginibacter paludis DSM 18603]|uniref:RagB/SusD domain-containing protein n=2 Tax=Mucilaginibacter TaxID=423349 RepID=H1Y0V8_9SPHI|nr:RagB/SusD domain-containing protein [Mucilaginibacter paludis DSM 18603]
MYKKIIYKSVLFVALMLSCSSCKKYLSLYPQDGVIRQEFWQNKEQIQSAVIGIYSSLLADPAGKDRQLAEYLFLWGELRADNVVSSGANISNDELNMLHDNILSTNSVVNWSAVYRTINYCNTVLDYAPNVMSLDKTLTQDKLNSYLGEALAIRSLMYFYLVRTYRDVPLKLKSTSSDTDIQQLAVTKSTDVLAQIVKDLATAEQYTVYTYGDKASDKGRITKYTINAIQADVYLWMEDYNNSITACDKIINSGQFGLVPGDSGFFSTLYYTGNSIESIFEFQFDVQALNSFYTAFQQKARFAASPNLMDLVYTVDYNDDNNYDRRGRFVAVNTSTNQIWKYIGVSGDRNARTIDQSYAHYMIYRYADVLLMKAEAMAYVNRGSESLDIIRTIRTRANALATTLESPSPSDANAVALYVLDERDREFSFEGKRWYDLLRYAKRNNFQNLNTLILASTINIPGNLQQSANTKLRDLNSLYLPIPYSETLNDPNLVQNPFYKN